MRSLKIIAAIVLVLGTTFVFNVPTADARPAARRGYVAGRTYGYAATPRGAYGYWNGSRGYAYGWNPGYNYAYYGPRGYYYRPGAYSYYGPRNYGYAYRYGYPGYGYAYSYPRYSYGYSYPSYAYGYSTPSANYGYAAPGNRSYAAPGNRSYEVSADDAPRRAGVTVEIQDNMFDPDTIQVAAGTTVRWVNRGRHVHTVTSEDHRWSSGELAPGQSYSLRFPHAGTYRIYCEHHRGMVGTLVVDDGAVNY